MEKEGFIKYLQSKDFSVKMISECVRVTELFLKRTAKEEVQVTKPDVLKYLEYLKDKGLENITRQHYLCAVNHYFTFLSEDEKIAQNPCLFLKIRGTNKKRLYKIYTPEELEQLYDAYYQLFVRNFEEKHYKYEKQQQYAILSRERNALIVSILTNQGITTAEIDKLEISDVDLTKATIKIRGGRTLNNRTLPLKASQIGLIINYLQKTRPQLFEEQKIESEKLFLLLPATRKKKVYSGSLEDIFWGLTKQIKTIDKQFINFKQVRASMITFWLKTQGLRKAQYFAGHRYISSTERYVNNNLDGLIDDINKLNPFDF